MALQVEKNRNRAMKLRIGKIAFYALLVTMPIGAVCGSLYFKLRCAERLTLNSWWHRELDPEHIARYEWVKQFCRGKTVADIACGTGYGMQILRTVATEVDGYDREPLGQEFVVDLEKQGWAKQYDVIVSFETIEHLANPEFFLENARRSCRTLVLSTPVNEEPGHNPYHKQFWTFPQLKALVETYFSCQWYAQHKERIDLGTPEKAAVAVCTPRERTAQVSAPPPANPRGG